MQNGNSMVDLKYVTHKREPFFEIAKKYIKKGDAVLDIGAGNGDFADYCQVQDIYLFDGNELSINTLKAKKYKNVFLGELPKLPYNTAFFDLIHISHVVEHLEPQELYKTIKEMDRCCKTGGRIIISTPLLWEGFYNDLSHVKPYNPFVFQKYLCKETKDNLTRSSISILYTVEELVYRFREREWIYNLKNSTKFKIFEKIYTIIRPLGFEKYEKTGYTIVLKKR